MKIEQTENGWQVFDDNGDPFGEPRETEAEAETTLRLLEKLKPKS